MDAYTYVGDLIDTDPVRVQNLAAEYGAEFSHFVRYNPV